MDNQQHDKGEEIQSLDRREFLKKTAKRTLTALAVTATAASLAYQKPAMKSFSGEQKAFAQATVTGKFSLKGTT